MQFIIISYPFYTLNIHYHTLANGIRLVHKHTPHTQIAHCGFVLDIGSRDESVLQQGIAHFWEHMAFKGTEKRNSFYILNRLEAVGGELNAYTTKEKICFYASFLDKHFDKAFELLTDITFNSIFPENQIDRERKVILEEMSMYEDAYDERLQDEFEEVIFENHSLGKNILGIRETVKKFKKKDFDAFVAENLDTHKIVFSSVGNIDFKIILKWAEKYLSLIPEKTTDKKRLAFSNFLPKIIQKQYAISQSYCAMGRTSYHIKDKKRSIFALLTNILGGYGLNSRLNLALREKHGYVYNVEAYYQPLQDTGLFGISFATDEQQLQKSIKLVYKELEKLREKPLGTLQMHQAKEQIMGQIAMSEENNQGFMLMMGKSVLDEEKIDSLADIFNVLESFTAQQLQDVAQEMLQEKDFSILIYKAH